MEGPINGRFFLNKIGQKHASVSSTDAIIFDNFFNTNAHLNRRIGIGSKFKFENDDTQYEVVDIDLNATEVMIPIDKGISTSDIGAGQYDYNTTITVYFK